MNERLLICAFRYANTGNILIQKHPEYGICITHIIYKKITKYIVRDVFYISGYEISNISYGHYHMNPIIYKNKYFSTKNNDTALFFIDHSIVTKMKRICDFKEFQTLYNFGMTPSIELVGKIYNLFSVIPRPARLINRLSFLDISVKTE
jgi:hypothetical protein